KTETFDRSSDLLDLTFGMRARVVWISDRDRQGPPMDRRFGARPRRQFRPDRPAGRKGRAAHPAVGTARLRLTPDRVGTARRHRAGRSHPHKARPRAALLLG